MKPFTKEETAWLEKQYNTASQFHSLIIELSKQTEVELSKLPDSQVETYVLFMLSSTIMLLYDKLSDYELLAKITSTKTIH